MTKVATTRPAAPPVARSAITGSSAAGCSASKRRATGLTSRAATSACCRRHLHQPVRRIDAFGLFTGQVGYAWNNVMLYAKGGAAVQRIATALHHRHRRRRRHARRYPLGCLGRRRPRIRLRAELVGWRRVQSHVHGRSHLRPSHASRPAAEFVDRSHPADIDVFTGRVNYRFGGPVVARTEIARSDSQITERPASRRPFCLRAVARHATAAATSRDHARAKR